MKTLKKFWLVPALIAVQAFVPGEAPAQVTERNQAGIRLGGYSGLSFRHWNGEGKSLGWEASVMGWAPYHGVLVSGLLEKNIPLSKENFAMYFGGGLFAGNYQYRPYAYYYDRWDGRWYISDTGPAYIGLEGVIGVDYYFKEAPIVAGLDVRPRFFKFIYPYPWDAGLNVRYRF